jgi:hypothetical protein
MLQEMRGFMFYKSLLPFFQFSYKWANIALSVDDIHTLVDVVTVHPT